MERICELLIKADSLLEKISVRGGDAYALVEARKMLKAAFDELAGVDYSAKTQSLDRSE